MSSVLNETEKPAFDQLYEYGSEIGKGRYSTVKKCYCKKTQQCYAAKIIKNFRSKNAKLNMNIVENEITALTIARPYNLIVNLYEVFYNRGETILILEYAEEKDLHIYLDNEGAFEEEQACRIIYQVLKAIEFLHSKNVLHLDIKPENVLLMKPLAPKPPSPSDINEIEIELANEENTAETIPIDSQKKVEVTEYEEVEVKLCDFSFSQILNPGKPILGMMGTVAYSAPEVLQYDALTKATDMWSLGVLAHVLLTEYTPFGNGTEELNQTQTNILNVRERDFECVEDYFDNISYEARDFIENLIKFKPKERLTIEQALSHSWFKKYNVETTQSEKTDLLANTAEEDKENFTNEKSLFHKNQITQSTNSIKLLSSKINSDNNHSLKFSNENAGNCKILDIIKDDKNNNNMSTLTETQLTKHVPEVHLPPARKSTTSVLDGILDTANKDLESAK